MAGLLTSVVYGEAYLFFRVGGGEVSVYELAHYAFAFLGARATRTTNATVACCVYFHLQTRELCSPSFNIYWHDDNETKQTTQLPPHSRSAQDPHGERTQDKTHKKRYRRQHRSNSNMQRLQASTHPRSNIYQGHRTNPEHPATRLTSPTEHEKRHTRNAQPIRSQHAQEHRRAGRIKGSPRNCSSFSFSLLALAAVAARLPPPRSAPLHPAALSAALRSLTDSALTPSGRLPTPDKCQVSPATVVSSVTCHLSLVIVTGANFCCRHTFVPGCSRLVERPPTCGF